jgi:hypothetical protein
MTIEDMNLGKIPYTEQRHTQTNLIGTSIPYVFSPLLRANEEILLGSIDAHSPNRLPPPTPSSLWRWRVQTGNTTKVI